MGRIFRTVHKTPFPEGFRGVVQGVVRPAVFEGRAETEPEIAGFLLELHIGVHGICVLFPAVLGGRLQVAAVQIGGPVGPVAGVGVRVPVVDAHRRFHLLDAGRVGIESQLGVGGKALGQDADRPFVVHSREDHSGIVDVLRVGDDGHLVLLGVARYQRVSAPEEAAVVPERVLFGLVAQGRAGLDTQVAEPALLVFLLQADVQHPFLAAVLDAGVARLLAFALDDADLVHHGCRQVVQRRRLVVEEECPPAHGDLVDLLAVELDLPVFGDLHSGHPQQQVLQHGIGPDPEGGGVELHRILLDDDGIAHVRDGRRLQELLVHLQPHRAHIHLLVPEIALFDEGLVPHHLHMEDIAAEGHLVQLGLTLGVGKREIGDGRVLGRDHIDGSERDRLVRERIHDRRLDLAHPFLEHIVIEYIYLRPGRQAEAQHEYADEYLLHT